MSQAFPTKVILCGLAVIAAAAISVQGLSNGASAEEPFRAAWNQVQGVADAIREKFAEVDRVSDQLSGVLEAAAKAEGQVAGVERFVNVARPIQRNFDEGEANQGTEAFNSSTAQELQSWRSAASSMNSEADRQRLSLSSANAALDEALAELNSSAAELANNDLSYLSEQISTCVTTVRQSKTRIAELTARQGRAGGVIDGAQRFQDRWFNIFYGFDSDEGPWARDGTEERAGRGWRRQTEEEIISPSRDVISGAERELDVARAILTTAKYELSERLGRVDGVLVELAPEPPSAARNTPESVDTSSKLGEVSSTKNGIPVALIGAIATVVVAVIGVIGTIVTAKWKGKER